MNLSLLRGNLMLGQCRISVFISWHFLLTGSTKTVVCSVLFEMWNVRDLPSKDTLLWV